MYGNIVRITKDLSFQDLQNSVITKHQAYREMVQSWILRPARLLCSGPLSSSDSGMALLCIELTFFEPHGQYLSGASANPRSKVRFRVGFDAFRSYLVSNGLVGNDVAGLKTDSFYEWARCGLFHSCVPANELLVDAADYSQSCLTINPIFSGWLVNPWKMLDPLENYINEYIHQLEEGKDNTLNENFDFAFRKLVEIPMEHYCRP